MAVTDLTGTTWVFNDDITPITNNSVFQINFSSNSYDLVALVTGQQVDEYDEPIEGVAFITYYKVYPSSVISDLILSYRYRTFADHSYTSWSDNSYKTITITGGVDATNATQILPASFKHYYKNTTLIGTGTYKFRPYTVSQPIPQLSTPQNVSADGTTVSWDEVENATSYEIFADGTSIGTVGN